MLFGTGSAKFTTTNGSSSIDLEYSTIKPDWLIRDFEVNSAVYDHYATYVFNGNYSEFWINVNLFKYDNPTSKFNEIYPHLFTQVYFWPHADGKAISGSVGTSTNAPMPFFIDSMKHDYLFNESSMAEQDVLSIHFKSVGYVNLSGSIIYDTLTEYNYGYPFLFWEGLR